MADYEDYDDVGQFTFTYRNAFGDTTTKSFKADVWMEAAEQFKSFLSGCGFHLQEDSIIIEDPYDFASQLEAFKVSDIEIHTNKESDVQ